MIPALATLLVFQLIGEAVHHLLAVEEGEALRPVQFAEVIVEFRGALPEVGQILVRQRLADAGLPRDLDVLARDLVSHPAGAGVQEHPHPVEFIEAELDEVVAATE